MIMEHRAEHLILPVQRDLNIQDRPQWKKVLKNRLEICRKKKQHCLVFHSNARTVFGKYTKKVLIGVSQELVKE